MKISVYTFVKDGIYFDFHVVPMLLHHAKLADEVIVNEGYSNDSTFEKISNLDSKIKIHRHEWDRSDPSAWSRRFKQQALSYCTGDWCILLDCDEFIPEWEFARLRELVERTDESILPMRYLNFYGNYRTVHANPLRWKWPLYKNTIHRNLPSIEVWGDGSNVKFRDDPSDMVYGALDDAIECHHFGFVRKASRLRHKWRIQRKRNTTDNARPTWDRLPGWIFDLLPHRWLDPDFLEDLEVYDGPTMEIVKSMPQEFIRDKLKVLRYLERNQRTAVTTG